MRFGRWFPRYSLRAVALVALAAPILAACAGDDDDDEGGASAASSCPQGTLAGRTSPVEITFWHSMNAANEQTLQRLTDEFNASQNEVRVELVYQGTYTENRNKYLTALRGGELPDLIQLEDTSTQLMIDSGTTLTVQECVDAEGYDLSDYLERVVAYYTVEGTLASMPFNVSNPVLVYNKTAFQEAGLDPEVPPTTLEEVRSYSEAIRDSGAAQHGIAIELSGWYIEQWFGKAGHLYIDAENGRSGPATAVEFNDDLGRELFTWLDEMVDAGLALNVGRNPMGTEHLLAVGTGEAAMTIATSASLGSIFQVLESGEFPAGDIEVGVGPMPGIEGDGGILVGGASLWIVNRSSPEEQEAAWTYVKWLNEPEQQARWHEGTGYIPIRKSAVETDIVRQLWTERPQFRIAYDQLLNGETNAASAGPVMGAYREVRDAVVQALERMMLEDVSPEDALSQAEREANAALEEYTSRSGA